MDHPCCNASRGGNKKNIFSVSQNALDQTVKMSNQNKSLINILYFFYASIASLIFVVNYEMYIIKLPFCPQELLILWHQVHWAFSPFKRSHFKEFVYLK
jgi:hypothetical protein